MNKLVYEIVVSYSEKTFQMLPFFLCDNEEEAKQHAIRWLHNNDIEFKDLQFESINVLDVNDKISVN